MAPNVSDTSQAPSPGQPGADSPQTDAQKAEEARVGNVGEQPQPSDAQTEQYRADQDARTANPNAPVARDANAEFGGESFVYGQPAE